MNKIEPDTYSVPSGGLLKYITVAQNECHFLWPHRDDKNEGDIIGNPYSSLSKTEYTIVKGNISSSIIIFLRIIIALFCCGPTIFAKPPGQKPRKSKAPNVLSRSFSHHISDKALGAKAAS